MMASINVFLPIDSRAPIHPGGCYVVQYIKHEKYCLTTIPKNEKRVENMTRRGVVLIKFQGVWKCDQTLS